MGSINPTKKRDYGKHTRINTDQSYQVAYWKQRFGISEEQLIEAVRETAGLARNVEEYLTQKCIEPPRCITIRSRDTMSQQHGP